MTFYRCRCAHGKTLGKQEVIHRDTDIVSAFRSILSGRIGPDRYDLWFADAGITIVDQTIAIEVNTSFAIEQIRKTFNRDVLSAGEQAIGQMPRLELQVVATRSSSSVSKPVKESASNESTELNANPAPKLNRPSAKVFPVKLSGNGNGGGRRFASLSTFISGDCNRLATCSTDLILNEFGQISPFFLHGPSGCGKTHLLEGIWSKVRSTFPRKRAVFLAAEQFTTYFLQALKGGGLPSFRRKYRGVDLLIIDDIQFFAGKQATIVELLHTIDANLREGGQLILAADRSPTQLRSLGEELLARLSSGLACEMNPLDVETRRQLLKQMAADRKLDVAEDVLTDVAENAPGDGRQLSGLLNRLWVSSRAFEKPVSQTMARQIVRELFPTGRSIVRLNDIEKVICEEFSINPETLKSNRRSRDISHPRMLAMWLARKHTRAGLSEISEFFGRRSHSTVLSAKTKVDRWMGDDSGNLMANRDDSVKEIVRRIEQRLKTG